MKRWMIAVLASAGLLASRNAAGSEAVRSVRVELPEQEHNAIKLSWPSIGCWFWGKDEFAPVGYKRFLDYNYRHSPFQLLTTSLRSGDEVTDERVRQQLFQAAQYAQGLGMAIVMDLDVRLARGEFMRRYPDELQELLRCREVELPDHGQVALEIPSASFSDHYTANIRPYDSVSGRLVRVYSYSVDASGAGSGPVEDITRTVRALSASDKGVKVTLPGDPASKGRRACVMAAFALFTPDVFAPHLLEFQRNILQTYAKAAFAGVCKDEWGFPGGNSRPDDYWFSRAQAESYARRRPGHDLVRDLLLMDKGEKGRERDRYAAINHYTEMNWQRNGQIEQDFYQATKEIFGPSAMVATHPTWWPFPGHEENRKNGLDWWVAKRDLAQTDESTPYCVRTALAKKWASPLWYNMYYERSASSYEHDIWRHALGGGRMNFHPIYPRPDPTQGGSLYRGDLFRAEARIRLLNYISSAPIQCPVAVVFGHSSALNWAQPGYADVGMKLTDRLWEAGFYADLIPSSEIEAGGLTLAQDGHVQYGPQRYEAAVLYHPEFDRASVVRFFTQAALGPTALYRVGHWTMDFEGKPFDGDGKLPSAMATEADPVTCGLSVIGELRRRGITPQTRSSPASTVGFPKSMAPESSGQCQLLDGTRVVLSGTRDLSGDPIQISMQVEGLEVKFDALGVAAVRVGKNGRLEAMAAGGLRSFSAGEFAIDLPERLDLTLWRDRDQHWHGLVQGLEGEIPSALAKITPDWQRLKVPVPDP